jgi:hypothetical protein
MAKRRLTKTAVVQAIRETKTTRFVDGVGLTMTRADGRHEVAVRLFDTMDDPRRTPAGATLIGHLEASGWLVAHRHGRRYSTLTVSEPASDTPEEG